MLVRVPSVSISCLLTVFKRPLHIVSWYILNCVSTSRHFQKETVQHREGWLTALVSTEGGVMCRMCCGASPETGPGDELGLSFNFVPGYKDKQIEFTSTLPPLHVSSTSVETNLFFERIRISNLIRNPEFFRIRIRILFVVRKFSNPNPNIRGSGKKIRIRIRIWRNIIIIQIIE